MQQQRSTPWFLFALLAAMLLALAFGVRKASAHDSWSNGEDVPEWVKKYCCDKTDVHHIKADAVHVVATGYKIDGYPYVIPYAQATPSPDGDYWGFWYEAGTHGMAEGTPSTPFCFFAPVMGF